MQKISLPDPVFYEQRLLIYFFLIILQLSKFLDDESIYKERKYISARREFELLISRSNFLNLGFLVYYSLFAQA
jgi:hypothetical protein